MGHLLAGAHTPGLSPKKKKSGDDGIQPEVLKRCDLDDLVLSFCNRALQEGIAPGLLPISGGSVTSYLYLRKVTSLIQVIGEEFL